VVFHWGNLHSFKAVVTDLTLRFTYFSSTGVPLRAEVDLSLRQFAPSDAFGPQNPTSGTPNPHRVHRVQPGETLDRISAKYYGDSTRWRQIAGANAIADPLALRPGSLLSIPGGTE
jgi:nucleoid-associated protein YgaU